MKLAIGTTFDYQLSIRDQFAALSKTAFQSVSLGANILHSRYLSHTGRGKLLHLSDENSKTIDSIHVPFASQYDISSTDSDERMLAVCNVALCLEAAKELKSDTIILHLNADRRDGGKQAIPSLFNSLEKLIETAQNLKIKIAAENLPSQLSMEFLNAALEEFKSEYFGLCYDSSHDQLTGEEPYRVFEKYVDRLHALHLSDNDGSEDRHWIPFTGVVDWQRVCAIIRSGTYTQPLLLEVENRENAKTETFLRESADAAEKLFGMITA